LAIFHSKMNRPRQGNGDPWI